MLYHVSFIIYQYKYNKSNLVIFKYYIGTFLLSSLLLTKVLHLYKEANKYVNTW